MKWQSYSLLEGPRRIVLCVCCALVGTAVLSAGQDIVPNPAVPARTATGHPPRQFQLTWATPPEGKTRSASLLLLEFPGLPGTDDTSSSDETKIETLALTLTDSDDGLTRQPSTIIPAIQPAIPAEETKQKVTWGPLMRQSLFYLTVMHSFRIAREPSTRKGMENAVVGGYFKALGAMHGWSDGDGYYENYLGHPLEGAVAGYLWIHNDPRYRNVEFGWNRDYWMSRLRAYAYAWAFSEQFEIGPISEASIGQIQRYCCAYGFVDHVITPNGGAVWIIGGDILDKYVVRPIEDRTDNPYIRIFARGLINPPLSFANMMAFKPPWHRENRPGVRDYDGLHVVSTTKEPRFVRTVPTFEMTASMPSILQFDRLSCIGGGGVGAFRLTDSWQWTAEVSGCTLGDYEKNWSGDSLTFTTGPQWISYNSGRLSPHVGVRVGGQKITQEHLNPSLEKLVLQFMPEGGNVNLYRPKFTTNFETTGLSVAVSGGLDIRLNRGLALRVVNFDYLHSWLNPLNGYEFNNAYRVSTGLVLRVGTW